MRAVNFDRRRFCEKIERGPRIPQDRAHAHRRMPPALSGYRLRLHTRKFRCPEVRDDELSYRKIKWLILLIPTLTVGVWEYVRHQFLLPYISMELGNWLTPLIVLLVTMLLTTKLFNLLEQIQEELQRSKAMQAVLQERENLARELHDGIAQSLFLLSVTMDQMEEQAANLDKPLHRMRQTVREVDEYVRQAITNLRYPPEPMSMPWMESLERLTREFARDTSIKVNFQWDLPETALSMKEKVELYASIREALLNVRKHAGAREVWIQAESAGGGWRCQVVDDGQGFTTDPFREGHRYGLKILKERAAEMGWTLELKRDGGKTALIIQKGGGAP